MTVTAADRLVATADSTPARVLLVPRRNLLPDSTILSNVIRLSGITVPVGVAVSEGAEVSVAGAAFTAQPTVAERGDAIILRTTAPAAGQSATVALTTGTAVTDWVVAAMDAPAHTHQTLYGPWGACSASAPCDGMGTQSRDILCLRSDGRFVAVTECAAGLSAVESRACPSPAGTTACVPVPVLAEGAPTQYCAAGSSARATCTGFTCPDPYQPQNGACVSTAQGLPVVTVAAPAAVREDDGHVRLTASLAWPALVDLTLPVSLDAAGSAGAGDVAGGPWSLVVPAGQRTGTLDIPLTNDALSEPDKTLVLAIATPGAGATLDAGSAVKIVALADDDGVPVATLSASAAVVPEDGTAPVTLTVSLDRRSDRTLAFPLILSGAGEVSATPAAITVAAGALSGSAQLAGVQDSVREGDEQATVTLALPDPTQAERGTPHSVTITVTDDDPIPTVTLSATGPVDEGSASTLTATLSNPLSVPVSVGWSVALAGQITAADFTGGVTSGSFSFAAGATTATHNLGIASDSLFEGPETATVSLGTLPPSLSAGAVLSASVTLTDQTQAPTISLSTSGTPGEGGTATLTATLSNPLSVPVSVDWSATLGGYVTAADFAGGVTSGTFSIAAGATTATQALTIADDSLYEPEEVFTVSLGALPAPLRSGTTAITQRIAASDTTTQNSCNVIKSHYPPATDGAYTILGGTVVWCEMNFQGGGWTLIRRLGTGGAWWPHNDNFNCAQTLGSYQASATVNADFGMNWCAIGYSDFMFTTGDQVRWLTAPSGSVYNSWNGTCGAPFYIHASDQGSTYTVGACKRPGNPEDPWISTQSHGYVGRNCGANDDAHSMLWGEAGSAGCWVWWKQNRNGIAVYVR